MSFESSEAQPATPLQKSSTQYLATEQLVLTVLLESIGDLAKLVIFICHGNQLTSEFPSIFLAPPKTQYTVLTE